MLAADSFSKHREWLASDAALQHAVLNVLLQCCLPAVAESAAGMAGSPDLVHMLKRLPGALLHPSLEPALQLQLQGSGALAAVQAAIQVIEGLPLPRPADMPAAHFCCLHGHAAQLLNTCTAHMAEQVEEGQGGGSSGVETGPGTNQLQLAAWRLLAAVPRLTSIVQALADDPDAASAFSSGPDVWSHNLNGACANLSVALHLLGCLGEVPATPAQLASWAAAGAAGLRLQPLLLQLDASFQQLSLQLEGSQPPPDGAEWLSWALLRHVWQSAPMLQEQQDAAMADSAAAQRSQAFRLWELHTATARLCHFLVNRGSPLLPHQSALLNNG